MRDSIGWSFDPSVSVWAWATAGTAATRNISNHFDIQLTLSTSRRSQPAAVAHRLTESDVSEPQVRVARPGTCPVVHGRSGRLDLAWNRREHRNLYSRRR